jgi:hypothetical protein
VERVGAGDTLANALLDGGNIFAASGAGSLTTGNLVSGADIALRAAQAWARK